jgi:type I site-specific restriction-modification system R (restriction) subunit
MWFTGFDAPSLHSMYVDKPMRGHGLIQAIARVNRVFKDLPGGLVVDYLGLADELRQALGLTEEVLVFYDALETNDRAVAVLGDETLKTIARELTEKVRNSATIDWTLRENVRAQMRVLAQAVAAPHAAVSGGDCTAGAS